jgi:hypothetical protein
MEHRERHASPKCREACIAIDQCIFEAHGTSKPGDYLLFCRLFGTIPVENERVGFLPAQIVIDRRGMSGIGTTTRIEWPILFFLERMFRSVSSLEEEAGPTRTFG